MVNAGPRVGAVYGAQKKRSCVHTAQFTERVHVNKKRSWVHTAQFTERVHVNKKIRFIRLSL